ncbi:protein SPEAR3 [Cannabis sativa]|uniref:protein SPEAR3 n=1 Tax=Cannabis sativa TaxID=3483 RepID=UPI0029C9CDED|nr:protein SPEAR3 [Cannabis sativa]
MGSGYFGEPNLGSSNERGGNGIISGSSNNSSRKGKKSSSEKPRQPQRGLGVAQLEKIRLHGQMGCATNNNTTTTTYAAHPSLHSTNYPSNFSNVDDMRLHTAYSAIPSSSFSYSSSSSSSSASYGFNPNIMMGLGEYERANIRYGDSQPTTTARWDPINGMLETQYTPQPSMTRHLLNLHVEESHQHTSNNQKHRSNSLGSSQNSESSDTQELDLELRLSL